MNRLLVFGVCLCWIGCCFSTPFRTRKGDEASIARACNPHLNWVEPGVLSLSFSCPSGLGGLTDDDALRIVPVLTRSDGKSLFFSPVVYLSRSAKRFQDRRLQYNPDALWEHAYYFTGRSETGTPFLYQDTLAVGAARGGHLEIHYYYANCCHDYLLATDTVSLPDAGLFLRQMLPLPVLVNRIPLPASSLAFKTPQAEKVKMRSQLVRVPLHYPSGRSSVEEGYMDNAWHLSRLDSLCQPVFSAPDDYDIQSIRVSGYASPEGEYHYNRILSEERAHGFASYLCGRYRFSRSLITAKGFGEDWEGLKRLVHADSLFERRYEVLAIIGRYGIFQGRERRLMELDGGTPYQYMLNRHFPQLRRMELEMRYRVRAFSPDEALEKLSTRPQDLDSYELYQAARMQTPDSLLATPHGRKEYGRAYDVAAGMQPDDIPTRLNAASAALLRYDLEAAYRYLSTLTAYPPAWNNIGVYYWMCGDTVRARAYFVRALQHTPEAEENMKLLDAWEEQR